MKIQIDVKKLIKDIRGPKGVNALTEELVKMSSEVEREVAKLKTELRPQAERKVAQVRSNLQMVQKRLKKAQAELDRELKKTVTIVKKYGQQAEQRLAHLAGAARKSTSKKKSAPRKKKTSKKVS